MTPPSEGLPAAQMEWERLGPGTNADNMSNPNSENSGQQQRTIADELMAEASLDFKKAEGT